MKLTSLVATSFLVGSSSAKSDTMINSTVMPDESDAHARTWMSFVASDRIWRKRQVSEVKNNLALIATTVAKYESVTMLVSHTDYDDAVSLLGGLDSHNHPITLLALKTNDLWLRDTGPTFVIDANGKHSGINFNFNGWGKKQVYNLDAEVAEFITKQANAEIINTDLTLEGGCFEVNGSGTAIMTESCIVNDNRNPNMSKIGIEEKLKALLGLRKIVWLKGIKGKDITDGHTDFYARFSGKSRVVVSRDNYKESFDYKVTRQNIETLSNATDADGNQLQVIVIDTPDSINENYGVTEFAAGYIGYYLCNNAVIMQRFGDKQADQRAKEILQNEFPDRKIEQLAIDGIASGGGSIHCATQQQPA